MVEQIRININVAIRSSKGEMLAEINSPVINADNGNHLLEMVIDSSIVSEFLDALGAMLAIISIAHDQNISLSDVANNSGLPITEVKNNNSMN